MPDNYEELAQLREELSINYAESDLKSASKEELLEMKEEIDFDEFVDNEIDYFKQENVCSRESLLESIRETRASYQAEAGAKERKHAPAFYDILDSLLDRFEQKVQFMALPDPLNDWWSYSYEISDSGISLLMNHFSWYRCGGFDYSRDTAFVLLEIPAKLLTVSEYAQMYGVEPVTVRQWIRRAKIRSAVKAGKEWRIPELAEVSKERRYRPCRYIWSETLTDLPEKFNFLAEFKSASFWQDEEANEFFCVELSTNPSGKDMEDHETLKLTVKEREELELYMIGNPLIRCSSVNSREGALAYNIVEFGNGYGDSGTYYPA